VAAQPIQNFADKGRQSEEETEPRQSLFEVFEAVSHVSTPVTDAQAADIPSAGHQEKGHQSADSKTSSGHQEKGHQSADSKTSVFQGFYSFPNAGIDFEF